MNRTCSSILAAGVFISEGSLRLVRICCVAGVAEIEVVGSSAVAFCSCGGGGTGDELRCVNCVCVFGVTIVSSSSSYIRMIVASSSERVVVVSCALFRLANATAVREEAGRGASGGGGETASVLLCSLWYT